MTTELELKIGYSRASRCWRSNNLRLCLQICDQLSREIIDSDSDANKVRLHLKQAIWLLKIKCLSEDCYVNESLLLNEDDMEADDQVRTFTAAPNKRPNLSRQNATSSATATGRQQSRRLGTASATVIDPSRTAVVTGRMPSASSRITSGRATSSYRPLTTSLTASQTAFSRSTRPLLKYATNQMLSKVTYNYLYNVQRVTNNCPDYRQCIDYLNIVQQSSRELSREKSANNSERQNVDQLVSLLNDDNEVKDLKHLDAFWLMAFGICYYNLRINKLALDYFEAARKANHKHLDAYLWLVKIYLRQNEPIKVLKTCDEGLQNSKNAILFNWKARVQSLLSDSYAAHLSLKDSLKFYPTNIEALANVGHFSFYGDKLDQALECFERINQLSANANVHDVVSGNLANSSSELLNNLALCNLYCGNLTRVVPLFQRAFLSSPNKEVTSKIWYNLSFVPLSFGYRNLAIACLRLALKNDSQNEEATNNLGVLKYGPMINDSLHFENRQELWSKTTMSQRPTAAELRNQDHLHRKQQIMFDEAESCFCIRKRSEQDDGEDEGQNVQPEMLFNMAVLKHKRGQLMSCINYCKRYLEYDQNNYMILNLMKEIRQLF